MIDTKRFLASFGVGLVFGLLGSYLHVPIIVTFISCSILISMFMIE